MASTHLVTAAAGATFLCGVMAVVSGEPSVSVLVGVLGMATAVLAYVRTAALDRVAAALPLEPELADGESGLFGPDFFSVTLEGRVATARRVLRPLSVVVFAVDEGDVVGDPRPAPAAAIAGSLRSTLRESDVASRLDSMAYAMLLEDTGEDGAVWTAERVRRNLAAGPTTRIFRAGVASYPTHGLTADELLDRARGALRLAQDWHRDRIEVAPTV